MNWRNYIITLLLQLDRRRILQRIEEINRVSMLPAEEIRRYQKNKLKDILIHSYRNVPYYTSLLTDCGVIQDRRVLIENFGNLPGLRKEDIRKNFDQLKSRDIARRKWYVNSSGGSTGEPATFVQDREYLSWNIANKLFIKMAGGQTIGEQELRLWGSERDILEGREKLSVRMRNWLYNRMELNTFCVTQDDYLHFTEIWNRRRPQWVEAYVQSIYDFADYIGSNNIEISAPRGIVTSAGTLYPDVRQKLETVFKCRVYNRYGSREVGDMACSCSEGSGLHLSPWNHFVEILDENLKPVPNGAMGDVYVTGLTNFSMPLIRYRIGDVAVPSEKSSCSCGNNTQILEKVAGREVHIFKCNDGKKVDGEYFTHLFYYQDSIKKFQVVQKTIDLIEIYIVGSIKEKDQKSIEQSIKVVMGNSCLVCWKIVDKIDNLKSGKFLYTISEVL